MIEHKEGTIKNKWEAMKILTVFIKTQSQCIDTLTSLRNLGVLK